MVVYAEIIHNNIQANTNYMFVSGFTLNFPNFKKPKIVYNKLVIRTYLSHDLTILH